MMKIIIFDAILNYQKSLDRPSSVIAHICSLARIFWAKPFKN